MTGKARDRRALVVAELLRAGWTAHEVSAGLKIIDAGGSAAQAISAMREAQNARRTAADPTTERKDE